MEISVKSRRGTNVFCWVEFPEFSGPVSFFPPASARSSVNSGKKVKSASLRAVGNPSKTATRKEKFPAVLVIHGFKGWSSQRHIQKIAEDLTAGGFVTIRPDLTKNPGNSELEFRDMTYAMELTELEDVYRFVSQMEEVDPERIGVCGHSLGGMLVAEFAARNPEIACLATLSAVYEWKFVIEHIFMKPFDEVKSDFNEKGWSDVWSASLSKRLEIGRQFYEDVANRNADDFAGKIKCPTLVVSSGNDESVLQYHADAYLKNIGAGKKKMEIIKGADHNYSGDALDRVSKAVCSWFGKFLLES